MKYYVTADVHGYFTELKTALTNRGFFEDTQPHKLIICGDLFDRGGEALQIQEFLLDLMDKDQLILIRGNHEDLAMDLLNSWDYGSCLKRFNYTNRTIDTVCQLTGIGLGQLILSPERAKNAFSQTPYIQTLIPNMVDYFETESYIFTHGWIPCWCIKNDSSTTYSPSLNGGRPPSLCGLARDGETEWKPPTMASSNPVRQSSAATGTLLSATVIMRTMVGSLITISTSTPTTEMALSPWMRAFLFRVRLIAL